MASELTWRQAIEKILSASAAPLHYSEITERIIADNLSAVEYIQREVPEIHKKRVKESLELALNKL
jgi:hypothetical protein